MRPLTLRRMRPRERRLLDTKLRTSTLAVRLHQRYRIVAEAMRGLPGPAIADRVGCDEDTVYLWLHRFNASGFETFERPTNPNGREPILTSQ
jgi:transposase